MSNQVGEPDGPPVGPLPGAVRFDADGHLEIYRDGGWQPLVELSDAGLPPLFRDVLDDVGQPAEGAAAEESDGGDVGQPAEGAAAEESAGGDVGQAAEGAAAEQSDGGDPGHQAPA